MTEALFSGGQIEHLESGWALMSFIGQKAHYWVEDLTTMKPIVRGGVPVRYYTSTCGLSAVTDKEVPALEVAIFQGAFGVCRTRMFNNSVVSAKESEGGEKRNDE